MNTIPEISSWPDGAVVDAIQGKITAVYERREVNGQKGPTTVQAAEIQDGAGNKIRLSAWGHPDLAELKGKEYVLHSSSMNGGKKTGVSVKDNTYNGKTKKELSVGRTGVFQYLEVYHKNAGTVPDAKTDVQEASKGVAPKPTSGSVSPDGPQRLRKISHLWIACYNEAQHIQNVLGDGSLSEDQFQACVSSLYIQACRDNISVPAPEVKVKEEPPF